MMQVVVHNFDNSQWNKYVSLKYTVCLSTQAYSSFYITFVSWRLLMCAKHIHTVQSIILIEFMTLGASTFLEQNENKYYICKNEQIQYLHQRKSPGISVDTLFFHCFCTPSPFARFPSDEGWCRINQRVIICLWKYRENCYETTFLEEKLC